MTKYSKNNKSSTAFAIRTNGFTEAVPVEGTRLERKPELERQNASFLSPKGNKQGLGRVALWPVTEKHLMKEYPELTDENRSFKIGVKKLPEGAPKQEFVMKGVHICSKHGCHGRIKFNSTRTLCWRHEPNWKTKSNGAKIRKEAVKQARRSAYYEKLADTRMSKIKKLRETARNSQVAIIRRNNALGEVLIDLSNAQRQSKELTKAVDRRNKDLAAANLELAHVDTLLDSIEGCCNWDKGGNPNKRRRINY